MRGDFLDALWVAAGFNILSFLSGWLIFGVLGIATLGLGFIFHFLNDLVTAAIVLKLTSSLSSRFDIRGVTPAIGTAFMLALAGDLSQRI